MTFRELTVLQEKSQNAAHTSAITHRVETNGGGQRWIAAGDGSREAEGNQSPSLL
jgi:hypothetical protein